MTKIYPRSEAPKLEEYEQAADELFPDVTGIYTDDQRRQINRRAWALFYARQPKH
jgi:hypothetical protein